MNISKRIKILVIDDEQGIRDWLSLELSSEGYEVKVAEDGEKGIQKAEKEKFNIIISNIRMPKVSGIEVLNRVKKISPGTMVIMMTGYAIGEKEDENVRKEAFHFIYKPFEIKEISSLLKKATVEGGYAN